MYGLLDMQCKQKHIYDLRHYITFVTMNNIPYRFYYNVHCTLHGGTQCSLQVYNVNAAYNFFVHYNLYSLNYCVVVDVL